MRMLRYKAVLRGFKLQHLIWPFCRLVLGWLFLVLGVLGLFLPFLQGLLFLAIGVVLLSRHVPFFDRIRLKMYRRFPSVEKRIRDGKAWMSRRRRKWQRR